MNESDWSGIFIISPFLSILFIFFSSFDPLSHVWTIPIASKLVSLQVPFFSMLVFSKFHVYKILFLFRFLLYLKTSNNFQ